MKIGAFTITTNPIKNQYPIKESILSWLEYVDEMIIVDGGSDDGFIDWINELKNPKIVLIQDEDVHWEDNWVYWRMGYNWARGFDECVKRNCDFIIKFDADYVVKEGYDMQKEWDAMITNNVLALRFARKNFMLVDRYFTKRSKTLAVNIISAKKMGIPVRWGYDLENWGLCDEAIIYKETKDKLLQGELLGNNSVLFNSNIEVFNYGYCFRDEETAKELMFKNMRAFYAQQGRDNLYKEKTWEDYIKKCQTEFKKVCSLIPIDVHPKIIQDRISKLTKNLGGYNLYGNLPAEYYHL